MTCGTKPPCEGVCVEAEPSAPAQLVVTVIVTVGGASDSKPPPQDLFTALPCW